MKWLRHKARWLRNQFQRVANQFPTASTSAKEGVALALAGDVAIIYAPSRAKGPLRQGEILSDVIQRRRSFRSLGLENPEIEEIRHPYAVVVTQDCDLEQDHVARTSSTPQKNPGDKLIPNVLLVEAVTVAELIAGLPKGKDILKRVCQNRDERYHVFERVEATEDAKGQGLPALGADFKRYFTVPTDELYAQLGSGERRRAQLNDPYLEHFAQRFAGYLSRVALPREHLIE